MQDRLQSIREWTDKLADQESSVMADIKFLLDAVEQAQSKLDDVADMYKASEHKNKLLNMALRAANDGNGTTDLRYLYDPLQGACQLQSLCNGVIVHIPVDWLTEIIDNKNSVIDGLQQVNFKLI